MLTRKKQLGPNKNGGLENPIVDCELDKNAAVFAVLQDNPNCTKEILQRQDLVSVNYISEDNLIHQGQIVIDSDLSEDVKGLFDLMLFHRFSVTKVTPISLYDWDDESSMSDNNTSAFNYRVIKGTEKLSLHSFGFALDINPRSNPVMIKGEVTQPLNGYRDLSNPDTLTDTHFVVRFMKSKGWVWGGDWQTLQDYHHFEKKLATAEYASYLQILLDLGYINRAEYDNNLEIANKNHKPKIKQHAV